MGQEPELNDDFGDLLRALLAAQVEFVIVGAHALAAHGFPRATGDLDVLVEPSPTNSERVIEALNAFGAPLSAHGTSRTDFEVPDNVQIGLPPRRIDLMTAISGVSFEEVPMSSRASNADDPMSGYGRSGPPKIACSTRAGGIEPSERTALWKAWRSGPRSRVQRSRRERMCSAPRT